MKIILNNRPEDIDKEEISISDLLVLKQFTFKMLVVKINGKLIKKDQYHNTMVHKDDKVQILHLMSGG
jgi:sulfur carrier protein